VRFNKVTGIILIILKFLIGSLLLFSSPSPEDGWFPVEKEVKAAEQVEENDPSIWVLFAKSVGAEKFLVRFPEDPVYRYLENGALQISSVRGGEVFELTVLGTDSDIPRTDLVYQQEEKWVHEHFLQTNHHVYHFKTLSNTLNSEYSSIFFSSILIDKND